MSTLVLVLLVLYIHLSSYVILISAIYVTKRIVSYYKHNKKVNNVSEDNKK